MSDTEINEGGPAFPIPEVRDPEIGGIRQGWDGMTLLDYFAASERSEPAIGPDPYDAAQYLGIMPDSYVAEIHWPMVLAKWRYQCADAMLRERPEREAR